MSESFKEITGDRATNSIIEQTNAIFNHYYPPEEVDEMKLHKIEKILRPVPDAQIDITILADGKCITDATLEVFAEYDSGDSSVGEPAGWLIHRIMLGRTDVTNEMDLTEIQQHLGEIL